jgi:hypothetical protein
VPIPCDDLKRKTFPQVERELQKNRFEVKRVDQPGGRRGEIVDISPCRAPHGSVITVTVSTGRGADESPGAAPGATPSCFGGGILGTCPPTSRP